jgi:hypothetical protein
MVLYEEINQTLTLSVAADVFDRYRVVFAQVLGKFVSMLYGAHSFDAISSAVMVAHESDDKLTLKLAEALVASDLARVDAQKVLGWGKSSF